jgi:YesN/AraC family two-component response regulator
LAELFLFIIRCHRFEQNVIREVDVDNPLMQEIATYIYQNYDKKLTLEDMSEKFNISRSYLSKKFKVITGFGFKEYVVNVRIQNACRLLLETNKSITDIAFECGFNDSNYFGDAFRHVKGVSPNKYRKQSENV